MSTLDVLLAEMREEQREQGKTLAAIDERTKATAEKVEALGPQVETADARALKALHLHDENTKAREEHRAASEGDPAAPGWWWRATPQALAARYPTRALAMISAAVMLPAALTLGLLVAAGPGGGLRVLLQAAGVRALYVPTPEPTEPVHP